MQDSLPPRSALRPERRHRLVTGDRSRARSCRRVDSFPSRAAVKRSPRRGGQTAPRSPRPCSNANLRAHQGAFTGATRDRPLLQAAEGGTLFLDASGDIRRRCRRSCCWCPDAAIAWSATSRKVPLRRADRPSPRTATCRRRCPGDMREDFYYRSTSSRSSCPPLRTAEDRPAPGRPPRRRALAQTGLKVTGGGTGAIGAPSWATTVRQVPSCHALEHAFRHVQVEQLRESGRCRATDDRPVGVGERPSAGRCRPKACLIAEAEDALRRAGAPDEGCEPAASSRVPCGSACIIWNRGT